ncbi:hypothetical protein [Halopseudomonas pelagia]|uniref:hypothetical protein n=1 Tax=Halopseudomonas pelagia TaxID=553151 RepID=UPI0003A584EE|nr:hypothetical protein [Halopseudomonas pelagia]
MSPVIYSVAALTFILDGAAHWMALLVMLPDDWLRGPVILIGWSLSLFYFYDVYH